MSGSRTAYVGSPLFGIALTILLGIPVLGFFSFAAFSPATLAVPIFPGKPVTIWFAYGLGLIAWSVLLAIIYVVVSNRAADRVARVGGLGALACLMIGAMSGSASAADTLEPTGTNYTAVTMFLVLVASTLVITEAAP